MLVTIGADAAAGGLAGLKATTLANAGVRVSLTQTFYSAQGQTVETVSASGLTTTG